MHHANSATINAKPIPDSVLIPTFFTKSVKAFFRAFPPKLPLKAPIMAIPAAIPVVSIKQETAKGGL
jgi:hypothetical protein